MIYHVTPSYPPRLGGLEKVVHVLAQTQHDKGLQVSVITSDHGAGLGVLPEIFSVQRLKSFELANTTIIPNLFFRMLKLAKEDVVHLHITQAYTPEMVMIAGMIKKYRYIAHVHLDVPPTGRFGIILNIYKKIFLKQVLRNAVRIIVPTQDYMKLISKKYGIVENKIIVVPNATDHNILSKPKKLTHEHLKLLFVGRLSAQKNIPLLIQSLSYYSLTYSANFHLNIIGDGEHKQSLQRLITDLNLSDMITLSGPLSGENLEKVYSDSDIFLLSSIAESFGIVLIEAMTKGLPIISTDIPAVRNVVHNNINGLLVDQNPQDFADAIHRIVSNRKLYKQISANNLKSAKDYGWNMINQRILKIYEDTA